MTRLATDHGALPPPARDPSEPRPFPPTGPAEFIALFRRIGEARIATAAGGCWLRPVHRHDALQLGGAAADTLYRLLDLPDGTFIARVQRKQAHLYVRVPDTAVRLEPAGPIDLVPRRGAVDLRAAQVPVLGSSLAAILTALLDRGPAALVPIGTLDERRR